MIKANKIVAASCLLLAVAACGDDKKESKNASGVSVRPATSNELGNISVTLVPDQSIVFGKTIFWLKIKNNGPKPFMGKAEVQCEALYVNGAVAGKSLVKSREIYIPSNTVKNMSNFSDWSGVDVPVSLQSMNISDSMAGDVDLGRSTCKIIAAEVRDVGKSKAVEVLGAERLTVSKGESTEHNIFTVKVRNTATQPIRDLDLYCVVVADGLVVDDFSNNKRGNDFALKWKQRLSENEAINIGVGETVSIMPQEQAYWPSKGASSGMTTLPADALQCEVVKVAFR